MNPREVLKFYERVLSAFHELDRMYYSDPNPTIDLRAAYHQRQAMIQSLRDHLNLAVDPSDGLLVKNPDTFRILVNDSSGFVVPSEPKCRLQHELKNCLQIILASTELLYSRVSDDPESAGRINHIVRTVQRMKERIDGSRCRIVQETSPQDFATHPGSNAKT